MSITENKEIYKQIVNNLTACNGDAAKIRSVLDKYCAPDYILHHAHRGDLNIDQAAQYYAELWAAFPDLELIIDDMIAEGDKLAVRAKAQGNHKGPFKGIPATGKRITNSAMQIGKIVEGKAVEVWELPDGLGMLIQLGVMPDPTASVH